MHQNQLTMKPILLLAIGLLLSNLVLAQKRIQPGSNSEIPTVERVEINSALKEAVNAVKMNELQLSVEKTEWTVGSGAYDFQTLQAAVESEQVLNGHKIYLYNSSKNEGYTDLGIYIAKSLEIIGNTTDRTVIDASNSAGVSDRRCFVIEAGYDVVLTNLTITKGYALNHWGGGIYNSGNLTLNNCRVLLNKADNSGGGICSSGSLTVNGGFITDNTAMYGGAIFSDVSSSTMLEGVVLAYNNAEEWGGGVHSMKESYLEFKNCSIQSNTAKYGGGAINNWGNLHLIGCDVFYNQCIEGRSGAVHNSSGALCNISDSRIFENAAHTSGGALSNNHYLDIKNTVFFKNQSTIYQGSAISNYGNAHLYRVTISGNIGYSPYSNDSYYDELQVGCVSYLTNCTVTNNQDDKASGISLYTSSGSSIVNMINSIVSGNKGGGVDLMQDNGTVSLDGNNLIGTTDSLLFFNTITDMIGVEPILDELTNVSGTIYYHPLRLNSPAINAIEDDSENAVSAAGEGSIVEKVGPYDIGAAESDHDTYNTTVWSIWDSPNHNFDTLNNVVVVSENDYIWSSTVNNLIIGMNGVLDVVQPLEVKGEFFNYGTGRSLIMHENVEFILNDNNYHSPELKSVDVKKLNESSYEFTVKLSPYNQIDSIEFEYGEGEEMTTLFKTNKLIAGVGEQTESFVINVPGLEAMNYRIRFVNQYYTFATGIRSINVTAADEYVGQQQFKVYPNPAKNIVNITLPEWIDNSTITIINETGQTVQTCETDWHNLQIDLAGLKGGMYWITCKTANQKYIQKLAVQP